ncbi:suppressor of cytokine signaling 6 [Lampetra fluviatilis]
MKKGLVSLRKSFHLKKSKDEASTVSGCLVEQDTENEASWESQGGLQSDKSSMDANPWDALEGESKHRSQSDGFMSTLRRKLSFRQKNVGKNLFLSIGTVDDDVFSATSVSSTGSKGADVHAKSCNHNRFAQGNQYDVVPLPAGGNAPRNSSSTKADVKVSADLDFFPLKALANGCQCRDVTFGGCKASLDPHSCAMELSLDGNHNPDVTMMEFNQSAVCNELNCNAYFNYNVMDGVDSEHIPGYSEVEESKVAAVSLEEKATVLSMCNAIVREPECESKDQVLILSDDVNNLSALNGNIVERDTLEANAPGLRALFIAADGPPASPLVPPSSRVQVHSVPFDPTSAPGVGRVYDSVRRDGPGAVSSLTEELKKLARQGWYWGPITRWEAEEKLHGLQDGSFLVRDSSDERYLLSLSFRSQNRTLHTRIEHSNGRFSFYEQLEAEGQASVVELVERSVRDSEVGAFCYSRSRLPGSATYPVRLTVPVSRFMQVRSLQYLCRFVIRQSTRIDLIRKLPLPSKMKDYLQEKPY